MALFENFHLLKKLKDLHLDIRDNEINFYEFLAIKTGILSLLSI